MEESKEKNIPNTSENVRMQEADILQEPLAEYPNVDEAGIPADIKSLEVTMSESAPEIVIGNREESSIEHILNVSGKQSDGWDTIKVTDESVYKISQQVVEEKAIDDTNSNDINMEEAKISENMTAEAILRDKFKYYFDSNGVLKNTETNEGFKFVNQAHYEALGDVIQRYVQDQMCRQYGMKEKLIPKKKISGNGPRCNIFLSKNWFGDCKKALLLIQGAGAVRAGIWARSVCINESLKTGSIFPFLEYAEEENFEVIVFNPNYCYDPKTHEPIKTINSLESHGNYLWDNFISKCKATDLYIVAHSCGGLSTMCLVKNYWKEFKERVKGIAFTDAVHGYHGISQEQSKFLQRYAVDWVASRDPLETPQRSYGNNVVNVSSGHHKHEYTTGSAYPSIFEFFKVIKERNPYLS